ncbi:MAG: tRNA-specific adenosine deaminase, partial [Clostridiales bacterium]|nr:tRNA-specific adenosine deaminase [Clostridiales bacterium]
PYNHRPELVSGFMADECSALLTDFFKRLREKKANDA